MSRTERVAVIGVGLLGRGIATVSARCNSRNDAFIKCDVAGGITPRTAKAQACHSDGCWLSRSVTPALRLQPV